jgi:hypothetical protein
VVDLRDSEERRLGQNASLAAQQRNKKILKEIMTARSSLSEASN